MLERCLQLPRGSECFALSLNRSWVSLSWQHCDPTGGEDLAEQGRGVPTCSKAFGVSGLEPCCPEGQGSPLPSQSGLLQGPAAAELPQV